MAHNVHYGLHAENRIVLILDSHQIYEQVYELYCVWFEGFGRVRRQAMEDLEDAISELL